MCRSSGRWWNGQSVDERVTSQADVGRTLPPDVRLSSFPPSTTPTKPTTSMRCGPALPAACLRNVGQRERGRKSRSDARLTLPVGRWCFTTSKTARISQSGFAPASQRLRYDPRRRDVTGCVEVPADHDGAVTTTTMATKIASTMTPFVARISNEEVRARGGWMRRRVLLLSSAAARGDPVSVCLPVSLGPTRYTCPSAGTMQEAGTVLPLIQAKRRRRGAVSVPRDLGVGIFAWPADPTRASELVTGSRRSGYTVREW
ncbi:uncharacterized protein J3D65DRAFT_69402 [Phyllosticta citribraziliensis]|uniref:Uncharacterized protein n=1 Tax=Phyllosticta citribraziliensis TaxID=989973 RepID=A0ABR1LEJ5_9PEZI